MANSTNLLLVSDKNYLNHLKSILGSIHKNVSSNIIIHTHLINVDVIPQWLYNVKHCHLITTESINCNASPIKFTRYSCGPLNGRLISEIHAYSNNVRYRLIPKLLKLSDNNLIYIDVDNIIRKDLSDLINLIEIHDISIFKYPIDLQPYTWRKFMTYGCGIIGINNNVKTIKFFDDMWSEVERNGILEIGDQLDFYNVYQKHKNIINLQTLPLTLKDWTCQSDSIIWSGDGNIKDVDLYKSEQSLYNTVLL